MGSIIMSVAVVSIGVALGMARGGRLDALRLLVVGLVKNAPLRGALIAAFGVALNLIVLAINGAVPIRFEALSEAGLIDSTTERSQITSVGHLLELETSDSRLASLGDTIPLGFLNSVAPVAAEAERIDLNFNPDDLWADEDSDVRVLGPSTKPNA